VNKGIGGHTKPNKGATTIWLTPKWIIDALGPFDLDPCAAPSPRPWDTAAVYNDESLDGLTTGWKGRVWLNPPYDKTTKLWLEKMANHDHGTALIFARTETPMFQKLIFEKASAMVFLAGRLYFHHPDGRRAKGNASGPSVLVSYGGRDRGRLLAATSDGSIPGTFVPLGFNR
jgi:DNA N-6-adenine-methyltransferase (Dam)